MKLNNIILAAAFAMAVGCSEDNTHSDRDFGTVSIVVDAPDCDGYSLMLSDASGEYSHTWATLADFQQGQRLLVGDYHAVARLGDGEEGLDRAFYIGEADFRLVAGDNKTVTIHPLPASALFTVDFSSDFLSRFPGSCVILHAMGGSYVTYPSSQSGVAWLTPTNATEIIVSIPYKGKDVNFKALTLGQTDAGANYAIDIELQGETVTTTCANLTNKTVADEDFLSAPVPKVATLGFESDVPLDLPEGQLPASNIGVEVKSQMPLESATLTIQSTSLGDQVLDIPVDGRTLTYKFDELVSRLYFMTQDKARSRFSFVATDKAGRMTEPVTLVVDTREITVDFLDIPPVFVGAQEATVGVHVPDTPRQENIEVFTCINGRDWKTSRVLRVTDRGHGDYDVTFSIPGGNEDVRVRFLYCEEQRGAFTVTRKSPEFNIEADAFANAAILRITAPTPWERSAVVRYLTVMGNGTPLTVASRDEEYGLVYLIGLSAETRYTFTATPLLAFTSDGVGTATATAVTERILQLENGNFEEMKEGIKWKNLPSGGRYSQNSVEIYNRQNHTTFDIETPDKWANTNALTFYAESANKNTWYMQPSAIGIGDASSGQLAVQLVSVGHDPAGEEIPDYLQKREPYLDHSPLIPHIKYHTAGELFLGSMSFEERKDGIPFTSRPRSLNGMYKYTPCSANQADQGIAEIQVYGKATGGKEILIGQGQTLLPLALGYTAFSVEIDYMAFGVKATRLCVSLRSSYGKVVTVDDPVTASSTGSRLCIDNLSLAY